MISMKRKVLKKENSRSKRRCRMLRKKWKGWADKFYLKNLIQRTVVKLQMNSMYGKMGKMVNGYNILLINELNEKNTIWRTEQKESEREILGN